MIIRDKNQVPATQTLNDILTNSSFTFYLTGSRFFGNYTSQSDTDYFVQYSPDVMKFLAANGFHKVHTSDYADEQVCGVYKHPDRVDIQLVQDAELKWNAQNYLKSQGRLLTMYQDTPKMSRDIFWNFVFAAVKGVTFNEAHPDLSM